MSMTGEFSIKKFLPRTLFGRSLMILVTPVLLIQVITVFVFFDRHWSKMTTRLAFAVSGELSAITQAVKDGADPQELENIVGYAQKYLTLSVSYEPGGQIPAEEDSSFVQVWEAVVAQKLGAELAAQISEPLLFIPILTTR